MNKIKYFSDFYIDNIYYIDINTFQNFQNLYNENDRKKILLYYEKLFKYRTSSIKESTFKLIEGINNIASKNKKKILERIIKFLEIKGGIYLDSKHKLVCEKVFEKGVKRKSIDQIDIIYKFYKHNIVFSKNILKFIIIYYNNNIFDNYISKELKIDLSYNNYNYKFINQIYGINDFIYIQDFINKQKLYIDSLSKRQKLIIKNYTSRCFFLYNLFIKNSETFIDEFKCLYNGNLEIGNGFFYQIKDILKFDEEKIEYDEGFEIENYYKTVLESDNYIIPDYIHSITKDQWKIILEKYIEELNNIILKTPKTEKEFFIYRGTSEHYIKEPNYYHDIKGFVYKTNQLSSFSIDFTIAEHFYNTHYNIDKNKISVIYRTKVSIGLSLLFVSPISIHEGELEIIAPINQLLIVLSDIKNLNYYETNKDKIICPQDNSISINVIDIELF